jgi:hypothetical protein
MHPLTNRGALQYQTAQLIERSYPEGVCCNDRGTLTIGVANDGGRSV